LGPSPTIVVGATPPSRPTGLSIDTATKDNFLTTQTSYRPFATEFRSGPFVDSSGYNHRLTQWEIDFAAVEQTTLNMPVRITTDSRGLVVPYENVYESNLTKLTMDVIMNRTRVRFRTRYKATSGLWSPWSRYSEFLSFPKTRNQTIHNSALDIVQRDRRGARIVSSHDTLDRPHSKGAIVRNTQKPNLYD